MRTYNRYFRSYGFDYSLDSLRSLGIRSPRTAGYNFADGFPSVDSNLFCKSFKAFCRFLRALLRFCISLVGEMGRGLFVGLIGVGVGAVIPVF